jgi:phosphoribosylglycinamide formyltransferase-1
LKNIVLFASGNGTNAENICRYFAGSGQVKVSGLICNNPEAKVFDKLAPYHIPSYLVSKKELNDPQSFLPLLEKCEPDLIVLAGFLLLIPSYLVEKYPNKIINLHPALLPKYGGKGMHGAHVHQAVKAAGEAETGISIHYVNERFDEGEIIFQARAPLHASDDVAAIAAKIAALEMEHLPKVIEKLLVK